MGTFEIVLWTLIIYSVISTTLYCLTKENDIVIDIFGLGIAGMALYVMLRIARTIRDKFKYHIGKRSIFEETSTGKKYKCKTKDTNDIYYWTDDYKLTKRYATKSEWVSIPDFSEDFIKNSKKNCDHCKHDKECRCTGVKCKHDMWDTVLEFDKFEWR